MGGVGDDVELEAEARFQGGRKRTAALPETQVNMRDHSSTLRAVACLTRQYAPFFFLLPFIVGTIDRLLHPNHWFRDFEAVSCGGQALNAHQPLYVWVSSCPDSEPTTYVYTPLGAEIFAFVQRDIGVTAEIALYGGIFWFFVQVVFRDLVRQDRDTSLRAPFLAGVPGNALWSGNFSIAIHGMFYVCRRLLAKHPALAAPLITATIIFKPTFVVYLALFLFLRHSLIKRIALIAGCGTTVVLYFIGFYLWNHAGFVSWQALMHYYGLVNDRGNGFLALPDIVLWKAVPDIGSAYAVFAVLILGAGLVTLAYSTHTDEERILLGISVCLLLYPRLMGYDMFTLPFGLTVIASSFERIGPVSPVHLRRSITTVCVFCMILSLVGSRIGEKAMFIFSCLLLVFVAASVVYAEAKVREGKSIPHLLLSSLRR